MPIIHFQPTTGRPECFLLLLEPDWSTELSVSYSLISRQAEGLTGIEHRTPAHRALRLKQSWVAAIGQDDLSLLKQVFGSLVDVRIASPIWLDRYTEPSSWVHASQWIASWSDVGVAEIIAPNVQPSHDNVAPLVFGRLQDRPEIVPLGGGLYECTFTLIEDSPWECRISPAPGPVPTSFNWTPDWSEDITDTSKDQSRRVEIGDGREIGLAGGDSSPRRGQQAAFSLLRHEAGDLLRFWLDRRGSVDSFPTLAWVSLETPTPQAPNSWVGRFDRDVLEYTFETPELVTCEVSILQEVSQVGDPAQGGLGRAHLYTLAWDGGATHRLTSWEHPLVYGGDTYEPARIEHSQLRETTTTLGNECDISIFAQQPGNPLLPLLAGDAERRLSVVIAAISVDADGLVTAWDEIFTGDVRTCELKDDKITGKASSLGGVFSRKLPCFYIQQGCNYCLFSACCGLVKSAWVRPGSLDIIEEEVRFTPDAAPTGPYADKWFDGGWLEATDGQGGGHRRAILDCSSASGTWILELNRPLPSSCGGRPASAYPGCDGNYSTCGGKYANWARFGGHPYTPSFIATSEGTGSTKTK